MKIQQIKLVLILSLGCISWAHANNAFDSVMLSYATATGKWSNVLLPVARYVFWFIASLEFMYQLTIKRLLPNELQKLWVFLIVRVFVASFLAVFVLDLNFYTAIISWMAKLGALCGGLSFEGTGTPINFSPSGLFKQIWDVYSPTLYGITIAAGATSLVDTAIGMFLLGLSGVIIICILVIVFSTMLVMVEAYFVIFGGIILAGFAGSSWTLNYWQKYLSYVSGVAVRLFCTSLLLGLISAQMHDHSWITPIPEISLNILKVGESIKDFLTNTISMLGVFGFNMILMLTLPSKAGAMLNGSVNAGLGEAINAASMAMSGGRMLAAPVAGALGGALKIAKGVEGAGAAAKSAGFQAMRDGVRSNPNNGSSDDKWKQMIRASGQDAAKGAVEGSIKGGVTAAKKSVSEGFSKAKEHGKDFTSNAKSSGGQSAGGAPLNIDPHKE
ncbi:MAG: Type secretory pathway TrbL component-like protein [Burkholderiales bacterium]|jgi:type IV secretion system protein TrbL|nr:Type secretory pathway TrbL component-like protein [Burkholderiales bacterium]